MSKVFIVERGVAYEGGTTIGVFSSYRAALERVREEMVNLAWGAPKDWKWEYHSKYWTFGYYTLDICEVEVQDIKPKPIPIAWKLP